MRRHGDLSNFPLNLIWFDNFTSPAVAGRTTDGLSQLKVKNGHPPQAKKKKKQTSVDKTEKQAVPRGAAWHYRRVSFSLRKSTPRERENWHCAMVVSGGQTWRRRWCYKKWKWNLVFYRIDERRWQLAVDRGWKGGKFWLKVWDLYFKYNFKWHKFVNSISTCSGTDFKWFLFQIFEYRIVLNSSNN